MQGKALHRSRTCLACLPTTVQYSTVAPSDGMGWDGMANSLTKRAIDGEDSEIEPADPASRSADTSRHVFLQCFNFSGYCLCPPIVSTVLHRGLYSFLLLSVAAATTAPDAAGRRNLL
ncbi:hypothetical protein VTL71DRAFT_8311, partial [Oculimacula yallundae]